MINGKSTKYPEDIRTQILREHINIIDDEKIKFLKFLNILLQWLLILYIYFR